jgi:serine/threonine-protein kinase
MSLKLTAASFLAGVKQSGLIDALRFDALLEELQRSGINLSDSATIAQALVNRQVLTSWQCEKLLQGRHKGFILGRYRLLSLLGTGEMSAVYLAEHIMMERRCAIKVLPANKVQDTSYLGRFHREARAVASLNHPNIVKAFDVDKQIEGGAEIHFLVMEYVSGKNLGKMVLEKGHLEYIAAADYIRQGADGLQHAHEAGLVHRDIKPENFLIDQNGAVKLLDLGLARFFNASDEESLTIKHDEKVLGTADFLAPEQAIDSHKVDLRADIYSLGCTLYYALTGHPPFTDGSLVQRLLAHQTRRPPSIKYDRPDVPEDLLAIIDKMMAKKPGERYQTAGEVADVLGRWLVQHAGVAWREAHPALVAKFVGMGALTRPAAPAPVALPSSSVPGPTAVTFASPQLELTEEQPRVVAPPVVAVVEPEPMRPEPVSPKPARDSVKAIVPARTAVDPTRRPALRNSPPTPVVTRRKPWDWEKTLAIGLLTLGTVTVIMIGVWLFGVNQQTTAANNDGPNVPAAQTTERSDTPGPQ